MAKVTCDTCGSEWSTWQSSSCPNCFAEVQRQIREQTQVMRGQPEGWYPDVDGGSGERYWNGAYWTEEVRGGDDERLIAGDGEPNFERGMALASVATMTFVQSIAIVVTFGALASLLVGIGLVALQMDPPNTVVATGFFFVAGATIIAMTISAVIALVRADGLGQRARQVLKVIPGNSGGR